MASETNDLALQTLRVEHCSLPKTGKKDAAKQAREATHGSGDCSDSGRAARVASACSNGAMGGGAAACVATTESIHGLVGAQLPTT